MRTEGTDVFLFPVLSSSTKGPAGRWLYYVGITPLSKQCLKVSGQLPYLLVKGPWYLLHRRVGGSKSWLGLLWCYRIENKCCKTVYTELVNKITTIFH